MTSKPKMSGPQAAIEVLKQAGEPLKIKDITQRVLDNYDTGLKGPTPVATLGARLHLAAKAGKIFVKVAPGTFGLLPETAASDPVTDLNDRVVEVASDQTAKDSVQVTPRPRPTSQRKSSRQRTAA